MRPHTQQQPQVKGTSPRAWSCKCSSSCHIVTTVLVTIFTVCLLGWSLWIIALVAYVPFQWPALPTHHRNQYTGSIGLAISPIKFLQWDGAGWWPLAGLVLSHRVAMEPPCRALYFQFPSSSIADWFLSSSDHFIISTTAQLNFKTWIKLWPSLFLRQFLMTLIRKSFFAMVRKLWILSTSPSPFNSYIKNFPPTNFFVGLWWSPAFPVFVCNLCNIQNGKSHSKMMSDIGKESSRIILNQRTQSGGLAHQELQTKDETFLL